MDVFWLSAAAMGLAAVAFLLPPLLRRKEAEAMTQDRAELAIFRQRLEELEDDRQRGTISEDAYSSARNDLARAVIDADLNIDGHAITSRRHPLIAIGLTIAVPALAFMLYLRLGAHDDVLAAQAQAVEESRQKEELRAGIAKLEQRLVDHPDEGKSWQMLGRAYSAVREFPKALLALERAENLVHDDADLLLDKVQVLAAIGGKDDRGIKTQLVERALLLSPQSARGLWLGSLLALEQSDRVRAREYLNRLLPLLPPGNPNTVLVQRQLDALAAEQTPSSTTQPGAVSSSPKIEVNVRLAPSVTANTRPDDTVFVFARAKDGPRKPLAAVRVHVKDLPTMITLDDSQAMSPLARLSQATSVVVGARISKSGQAIPSSGDWEGYAPAAVSPGAGVTVRAEVVIDSQLP